MDATRFTAIDIDGELYKGFKSDDKEPASLNNLSQVNIFIGANNSGKSRFLRKIFADEDLSFRTDLFDIQQLDRCVIEFKDVIENEISFGRVTYYHGEDVALANIHPFRWLKKGNDFKEAIKFFKTFIKYRANSIQREQITPEYFKLAKQCSSILSSVINEPDGSVIQYRFSNIYIPTLRGLRPIQKEATGTFNGQIDNYSSRTRHDYFKKLDKLDIITGLNLYNDLNRYSRGGTQERYKKRAFERFLSETFFNNEDVELTPNYDDDVVHVKIGNIEEQIFNLGDGIQTIIILTYPLFFNQGKPMKIFYDEPELHLHPGYQRIFLETLLRPEFTSFQYFLTTHSNHLLDMTLDTNSISVYTFQRMQNNKGDREFLISNVENSNVNILSLLGVRNSSVFLSNCTIWVEGISDRIYIRKYLDLIQKEKKLKFKEDTHFSFVEYSGNNITHWSFLENEDPMHANIMVERLCGKVFLIADNDGTGTEATSKKYRRYLQLKQVLGDRFLVLTVREIENLLTPEIIASVINDHEKEPVDAAKLDYNAYRKEYLGKYIHDAFPKLAKKFKSPSGTVLNKVEFAKKAVLHIQSEADLSKEAIELAESIYNFVASQNTQT